MISPNEKLDRVALLLYNTYETERRRHWSARSNRSDINAFVQDLDALKSTKAAPIADENIEDQMEGKKLVEKAGYNNEAEMWKRVARTVIRENIDPETYIRAQFAVLGENALSPKRTSLSGPVAVANFHRAAGLLRTEVAVALKTQTTKFKTETFRVSGVGIHKTDEAAWAEVLDDRKLELSALFRHCLAVSISKGEKTHNPKLFTDLADLYFDAAALQYVLAADAYDEVWVGWIPEHFRGHAQNAYARIHGANRAK